MSTDAQPVPPTVVFRSDTRYRMVRMRDDSLAGFAVTDVPDQRLVVITSRDGALWSDAETVLSLDEAPGRWAGVEAVVDAHGVLHVFLLNDRNSGVFAEPAGEENKQKMRELGANCIDIWHTRSRDDGESFSEPRCIWQGYTGALNSVVAMDNGRVLLPFSYSVDRRWGNRGSDVDDFTFWGYYRSEVIYTDDSGDTFTLADAALRVPVPDISYAYGAVEPVAVQCADGKVLMLIRTQMGRFYRSLSDDGARWSTPRPTNIISSDSPAGLVRLSDGRLVLLWNQCLRFPYAYGGRHVLHAAVSHDGESWDGCREVYRDPRNDQPPPHSGDHGTAYPFPVATADDRVLFTTGQGEGRIAVVAVDPKWLLEARQTDTLPDDIDQWSTFGTGSIGVGEIDGVRGMHITRQRDDIPAAAVRNFPATTDGGLVLRLRVAPRCGGVTISLTDHFSVPFDCEDRLHAISSMTLGPDVLTPGSEHEVKLKWAIKMPRCLVWVDHKSVGEHFWIPPYECIPNYVRLSCAGDGVDKAGFVVESMTV